MNEYCIWNTVTMSILFARKSAPRRVEAIESPVWAAPPPNKGDVYDIYTRAAHKVTRCTVVYRWRADFTANSWSWQNNKESLFPTVVLSTMTLLVWLFSTDGTSRIYTGHTHTNDRCIALSILLWYGRGYIHCTLYTVHCTLYTVHCTMYTVQCTGKPSRLY